MNKKKTIRLKDPKLRKIRTELRTLLVREAYKRIANLTDKQGILRERRPLGDENFLELDNQLENQKNQLRKLIKASICSCVTCSDMKEDHVFSPKTREWYCEKCYERLKKRHYFSNDYLREHADEFY